MLFSEEARGFVSNCRNRRPEQQLLWGGEGGGEKMLLGWEDASSLGVDTDLLFFPRVRSFFLLLFVIVRCLGHGLLFGGAEGSMDWGNWCWAAFWRVECFSLIVFHAWIFLFNYAGGFFIYTPLTRLILESIFLLERVRVSSLKNSANNTSYICRSYLFLWGSWKQFTRLLELSTPWTRLILESIYLLERVGVSMAKEFSKNILHIKLKMNGIVGGKQF